MNKTIFIIALTEETNIANDILGYPIIYSGVGKINATMAAYRAFSEGYKTIINIGSCGSLKHPAGTIIKVGSVYQDIDGSPLCEYGQIAMKHLCYHKCKFFIAIFYLHYCYFLFSMHFS